MEEKYSISDFRVFGTQCGPDDRLSPYVLMGMLQEAAERSASEDNFGTDLINTLNACWIVLRTSVEIIRLPKWGDTFHIRTWCSGLNKFYFSREYEAVDDNGEVIITGTSIWIMASMDNHRPVIPAHVGLKYECSNTRKPFGSDSPKLAFPDMSEFDGTEPAALKFADFSELDHNHHVNNSRYTAWAMDAIHLSGGDPEKVKTITVNFVKEVYDGEKVQLFVRNNGQKCGVFGYKGDGEKVFSFEADFYV